MMAPFDLEAGVKGQIQHLEKILRPMTSYKLFFPRIREDIRPF